MLDSDNPEAGAGVPDPEGALLGRRCRLPVVGTDVEDASSVSERAATVWVADGCITAGAATAGCGAVGCICHIGSADCATVRLARRLRAGSWAYASSNPTQM